MNLSLIILSLLFQVPPEPPTNLHVTSGPLIDHGANFKYIPPRVVRTSATNSELRQIWADCAKVVNAPATQEELDLAWSTFWTKLNAAK